MLLLAFFATVTLWLGGIVLVRHGRGCTQPAANEGPWDGIIVLGCDAPEGRAGTALRSRVEQGATLFHLGLAPKLLITGGLGVGERSEAAAGGRVANDLGVPPTALILEDRAKNTEENARLSGPLLEGSRYLVVTDGYHVFRSRRLFKRYFRPAGTDAGQVIEIRMVASFDTNRLARWKGTVREVVAVFFYLAIGRI